jgi:hypothetical protein
VVDGHAGQQSAMPVIGFLSTRSATDEYTRIPFHRGLKEAGYVEGQNVSVDGMRGERLV